MHDRTGRAYDEAEREAFARLPWTTRLKANLLALAVVSMLALLFAGPTVYSFFLF